MFRHMVVSALAVDSLTKSPIVILKEVDGERTLPIWIGLLEANAIASELEGIRFSRPMTHDLFKNLMERITIMSDQTLISGEEILTLCPVLTEPCGAPAAQEAGNLKSATATAEEAAIRKTLAQTSWNVSQAAKILGIDRVTLHKKIKKLGIEKKIVDG